MAVPAVAALALDPEMQDRLVSAVERAAEAGRSLGSMAVHGAGLTADEGHEGVPAVLGLAAVVYLRLRKWYAGWSASPIGQLVLKGQLPSVVPKIDWTGAASTVTGTVESVVPLLW